jgi:hypothetical protein
MILKMTQAGREQVARVCYPFLPLACGVARVKTMIDRINRQHTAAARRKLPVQSADRLALN